LGVGVNVEDQFTVFAAAGAVLFMLLSGVVLARFSRAYPPLAGCVDRSGTGEVAPVAAQSRP
jgi:hypothetical protein